MSRTNSIVTSLAMASAVLVSAGTAGATIFNGLGTAGGSSAVDFTNSNHFVVASRLDPSTVGGAPSLHIESRDSSNTQYCAATIPAPSGITPTNYSRPTITSDGWLIVGITTGSGYQLYAQHRTTGTTACDGWSASGWSAAISAPSGLTFQSAPTAIHWADTFGHSGTHVFVLAGNGTSNAIYFASVVSGTWTWTSVGTSEFFNPDTVPGVGFWRNQVWVFNAEANGGFVDYIGSGSTTVGGTVSFTSSSWNWLTFSWTGSSISTPAGVGNDSSNMYVVVQDGGDGKYHHAFQSTSGVWTGFAQTANFAAPSTSETLTAPYLGRVTATGNAAVFVHGVTGTATQHVYESNPGSWGTWTSFVP